MDMAYRYLTIALLVLAALTSALPARAASDDDRYTIMVPEKGVKPDNPEPWLAPKYKSPRGTPERIVIPRSKSAPPERAAVPPPIVVPETGRVLPNLPTVSGSGPNGAETSQDRAMRCAHQAGVYGQAAGNPSAYIGSCINQ
jgi:hypothetical protein